MKNFTFDNIFNINSRRCNIILGSIVLLFYTINAWTSPDMFFFSGDEIHAYNIAKHFNFFEIIQLMRGEGHTFLWYLILKPFTNFENLYPWIMKLINFIFMFCAVAILWFRAPFNLITKTLIIYFH